MRENRSLAVFSLSLLLAFTILACTTAGSAALPGNPVDISPAAAQRVEAKLVKALQKNPNNQFILRLTDEEVTSYITYSLEEVMNSVYVCDPLRLYMICPVSTGAAAVIVTADKELISKADNPVKIDATTMGSAMYGDPTIRISALSCPSVAEAPMLSESYSASQQAYKKAGIGPEDVDILELPDNSSWHYLVYLETCGFCKEGEADKMLRDGETKIGGKLPVNPSGGFSSHGEALSAQALWQVIECANQLRGRCGERQVENPKVAMAQTYGLMGNSGTTIMSI